MTNALRIGLLGCGNIGCGVYDALQTNGEVIAQRIGRPLVITRIAVADLNIAREDLPRDIMTEDGLSVTTASDVDVAVELIGGTTIAHKFVVAALQAGKHVVTANKALLATYGGELFDIAETNGVHLLFEASVGGGIPNMRAMQLGLSANRFNAVFGILNGTCNYILTNMADRGIAFETMLDEAKKLGYAEPDPTYDIEGYDTAHKTAILASLAFQQDIRFDDVHVEGITRIKPVDLEYARELGYAIKLLGIAKQDTATQQVEARVHPTLVPRESLLANVGGVFNGILFEGDLVGRSMLYGRGAGAAPTASAVLSDVMAIADGSAQRLRLRPKTGFKNLRPMGDLETAYYIRFQVSDRPGIMAKLSGALADQGVSISSMIQRGHQGDAADVILVTHTAKESAVQAALQRIASAEVSTESPFLLRVEDAR